MRHRIFITLGGPKAHGGQDCRRYDSASGLRLARAFEMATLRQVFHSRLMAHGLWIQAEQVQKFRGNIAAYRQAEALGRLVGDG